VANDFKPPDHDNSNQIVCKRSARRVDRPVSSRIAGIPGTSLYPGDLTSPGMARTRQNEHWAIRTTRLSQQPAAAPQSTHSENPMTYLAQNAE
jgi:hypothetical protein